jgi:hypothetical protein
MLEGLFQGWPGTEGIDILIDQARKSPEPILSLVGIRCRIKQGKHDADDFGAVMRLASWGSLDTYEFRSDIVHALVSGWPGDRRVYDACWEAWIGENRREGIDFDIAEAVLLGGFQNDDNVVKHLCDILTTKEHGFSGMGTPWHTLRSSFFGHPLVSAAVDERMERWLKQGTGFYREIALGCTVSGSEKAKALLISALKGAGWMVFWPVSGLIEVWGMDDAEVSAALSDLVRCPPGEMQYFAQSLPEILGKTASCRALLLEIARQPKVERPDFLVEGMVKLGEKLWDGELVDAAVALMSHGPGLFDPTPLIIQSFGSDPRVRQRVIDLIDRCDAPLASVALSYKDDSEIRSLLLARLAPLPDNLREVVVDQASRFASDLSSFETALARYGDEREGPIRAAAAAAYYASVPDSSRHKVHISRLVEELRAVGPQMDSIRQSALSGLLALNQFSVFRDLAERDGTRPLRCPALDGSIHQNDRLVEQIAARWTTVADVLGESTLSRLSTWGKGNPTEAWDRLAPFITTSVEAFDAFLTYCRSSPDLLKANSLAALSRLQPGSALLREICERTLRHEGDHISFSPYDGLAARMTAGQILGSAFNTVAGLRELLEAVARRPCSGAITALCVGWPQSKVIDEVFEYLVKEERTRLLPPAILNVFAVKGDSGIFVRAIRGLIAKSNGSIWDFPSFCVEAIARRLSIDDDVYTKVLQLLSSDASADELASLPRVMAMARSGDNTLQVWCEEELIKRVSDAGLCLSGLDFSSGRVRPVAQTLLDVLVHVA